MKLRRVNVASGKVSDYNAAARRRRPVALYSPSSIHALESVPTKASFPTQRSASSRWLRRGIGIVVTLAIFAWIVKPIVLHWPDVKDRIHQVSWGRVLFASLMFSAFLFVFRASTWRRILIGFGYRLPMAPAMRIWSSSELSRYLPGVIWQVVSRIYLVSPYGVRGSVC